MESSGIFFGFAFGGVLEIISYDSYIFISMIIKKSNIFIYPLENKVIFPYHEYAFSINSNVY